MVDEAKGVASDLWDLARKPNELLHSFTQGVRDAFRRDLETMLGSLSEPLETNAKGQDEPAGERSGHIPDEGGVAQGGDQVDDPDRVEL